MAVNNVTKDKKTKKALKKVAKKAKRPPLAKLKIPQRVLHPVQRDSLKDPFGLPQFPPGVAPKEPSMAMDSNENIVAVAGWGNSYYGGAAQEGQAWLGFQELSLLALRTEYRRMVEVIATEATRKWIRITAKGDNDRSKEIDKIKDEFQRLKVQDRFRQCLEIDGFFGRSHLYIDTGATDNPKELVMPIGNGWDDVSKVKVTKGKLQRLQVVEPVWTYPQKYNSNDPLKADWYKPQTWLVLGKELHVSRLLYFCSREVPDILKPSYSFGGLSLTQIAIPYVQNWLKTRQSVADLIRSFSVSGLATDLQSLLQEEGDGVLNRMQLFNQVRDNNGSFLLDKDSEEFFNVSTPLGTLDALQSASLEQLCTVSGIPVVKLLGIQPNGMNASSEGEIRTFYDWIGAYQEAVMRDNLQAVLGFAQLNLFGKVDPDIIFEFEPLWSLTDKEKAEVEKLKSESASIKINDGVIDQLEERKRVASEPGSPYASLDVTDVPELPEEQVTTGAEKGLKSKPTKESVGGKD